MATKKLSQDLQDWVKARKRFHLSHAQVQMARELGMNPRKLGKLDNHKQEPWKAPLPEFTEHLYFKSFGRERPAVVMSIEERAQAKAAKRAEGGRRRARAAAAAAPATNTPVERKPDPMIDAVVRDGGERRPGST
jgi:hypothetical protein